MPKTTKKYFPFLMHFPITMQVKSKTTADANVFLIINFAGKNSVATFFSIQCGISNVTT